MLGSAFFCPKVCCFLSKNVQSRLWTYHALVLVLLNFEKSGLQTFPTKDEKVNSNLLNLGNQSPIESTRYKKDFIYYLTNHFIYAPFNVYHNHKLKYNLGGCKIKFSVNIANKMHNLIIVFFMLNPFFASISQDRWNHNPI